MGADKHNNETNDICPECGGDIVFNSFEEICKNCGLVIEKLFKSLPLSMLIHRKKMF